MLPSNHVCGSSYRGTSIWIGRQKSRRDRGSGIGFDILHTRPPLRKNSFGYLLSLLIIVATLLLDSAVVATPLH